VVCKGEGFAKVRGRAAERLKLLQAKICGWCYHLQLRLVVRRAGAAARAPRVQPLVEHNVGERLARRDNLKCDV
jgi:hypothetical protein